MLTEQTIPQLWKDTLAEVQAVIPNAVLAGGALRDLDNGKPVKDVDIFILSASRSDFRDQIRELEKATGWEIEFVNTDDDIAADEYREMTGREPGEHDKSYVGDAVVVGGLYVPSEEGGMVKWGDQAPLNIIGRKDNNHVDSFDFGICRIGYDGKTLYRAEGYDADQARKVFTLNLSNPFAVEGRSMKRWERLRTKYIGWELNVTNSPKSYLPTLVDRTRPPLGDV